MDREVVIRYRRKSLVFSRVGSAAILVVDAWAVLSGRHDVVSGLLAVAALALGGL